MNGKVDLCREKCINIIEVENFIIRELNSIIALMYYEIIVLS